MKTRIPHFLLLCAFVLSVSSTSSAQGIASFDTEEHDFGSIMEGDKPTYTFAFGNDGTEPIRITHVQPSCGCTAPSYSTEPVEPGDRGEVVVEYNSQGRPGDFNKTITVSLEGAEESNVILRITGTVIPTQLRDGVVQGSVMFDHDSHEFRDLTENEAVERVFRMQNNAEAPLRVNEYRAFADGIQVNYPERPIFPGEIVNILVRVENVGEALNARGRLDVAVTLYTDDEMQPVKSLRLTGRIAEENSTVASQ